MNKICDKYFIMDKERLTAQEIFIEIVNNVYPSIELQFSKLRQNQELREHYGLHGYIKELEREFLSLAYYEKKLVFPALMDKINHDEIKTINQNPEEILALVSRKENKIFSLVNTIESLFNNIQIKEKQAIFDLLHLFKTSFKDIKDEWCNYLKKLSLKKVCPVKGQA